VQGRRASGGTDRWSRPRRFCRPTPAATVENKSKAGVGDACWQADRHDQAGEQIVAEIRNSVSLGQNGDELRG
jgi:hypothetical protein